MDKNKKAEFVKKMGKKRSFSKGGMIRKIAGRKYFDDGGTVLTQGNLTNNTASNPNTGVMGTIGNALGVNNQFQAGSANITPGTNIAQLNDAYNQAQGGINQVQGLASQLIPQTASAVQNQNEVANQLLGITQGTGPNPAQRELAQQTAANVAQTGAQMAGARGASGNVGLMARQIGQQGAQTQQQAAGQEATLQAQQQIAAQQGLANLANTQIGQAGQAVGGANSAIQNEQNTLQGANTAANNAAVGMQSNINSTNASTAMGNQGMMGKLLGGVGSGLSSALGLAHGGEVGEDGDHIKLAEMNATALRHGRQKFAQGGTAMVGNPLVAPAQAPMPSANWGGNFVQSAPQPGPNIGSSPVSGGDSGGDWDKDLSSGIKSLIKSKPTDSAPGGFASDPFSGAGETGQSFLSNEAHGGEIDHDQYLRDYFSDGGQVPAMVSPGEIYLSPEKVHAVTHGDANPLKIGEKIGGTAKVKGDSLKNDTVPKTLEEGGVVIPRHVVNKMNPEKAALFVHRSVAKKRVKR